MLGIKSRPKPLVVPEHLVDAAAPYVQQLADLREIVATSPLKGYRERAQAGVSMYERIVRAFAAGYEPTTVPGTTEQPWYCGFVEAINRDWWEVNYWRVNARFPVVPLRWDGRSRAWELRRDTVFTGLMPVEVQQTYVAAKDIFGKSGMVVYSPDKDQFVESFRRADPVLIGWLPTRREVQHERTVGVHFEIARWDTSRDLEFASE